MIYSQQYIYLPVFEETSGSFSRGFRYKKTIRSRVLEITMTASENDAISLDTIAILSDQLQIPIEYDFEENTASIRILSSAVVKKINP